VHHPFGEPPSGRGALHVADYTIAGDGAPRGTLRRVLVLADRFAT
jgi:hypothetical protein